MKLIALMKKEFHRFFHDPKLVLTMLMPGVVIFVIYTLLGNAIWQKDKDVKYEFEVLLQGESAITQMLETSTAEAGWELTFTPAEDAETARLAVKEGKATAYLSFSENFDEEVAAYTPANGLPAPQVKLFYRAADSDSMAFYTLAETILNAYENSLANKFDFNLGEDFNLSSAEDITLGIMSGLLPFLVVIFVFSACMSITLESVAGEKERGTLSTILVTSVKRSHVALGKIIPLSCIAVIGAASSFLGVVLSMPKLMGMSVGSFMTGFGFLSYFLLFLLIVSIVPLIVSLMTVVSAYAKSVKEASAYTSVLMILVMLLSIVSAFVSGIGEWIVAIPVLNSVICMQQILTMSLSVWQSLVAVGLNLAYTALLVLLISKMLSSEKIMFGN
jgi:sodium transport system permease protein